VPKHDADEKVDRDRRGAGVGEAEGEGDDDLVPTGRAAKMVGVTRQAVLAAVVAGRLVPVRAGLRGVHLFRRRDVLVWGAGARRSKKRKPRSKAPSPEAAAAAALGAEGPPGASPVKGSPGRPASLDAAFARILSARAVSADVVKAYREALLADAARRRAAADVEAQRSEVERLRLEVEREEVEALRQERKRARWTRMLKTRLLLELRHEELGDSAVNVAEHLAPLLFADASDANLEEMGLVRSTLSQSFARMWKAIPHEQRDDRLLAEDPKHRRRLLAKWTSEVVAQLRAARAAVPAGGKPPRPQLAASVPAAEGTPPATPAPPSAATRGSAPPTAGTNEPSSEDPGPPPPGTRGPSPDDAGER
jgi:hypothetical protein